MTTLFDLTLQLASKTNSVTPCVVSAITINESGLELDRYKLAADALTFVNGHLTGGTCWITSGSEANIVTPITASGDGAIWLTGDFSGVEVGDTFSILPPAFPYVQLVAAVNAVFDDSRAWIKKSTTATGDGETFVFYPSVAQIISVELEDDDGRWHPSHHWRERKWGELAFPQAHTPPDGWTIHIWYKGRHNVLASASDTLDGLVSVEWVIWSACVELYRWALRRYPNRPDLMIEQFLAQAQERADQRSPHMTPTVIVHTAGTPDVYYGH